MIDIQKETVISFTEAAKLFASYRQGKPAHVSRLHRYRLYGYRGVHLEALRQGGQWVTSREAVARFTARLTPLFENAGLNRQEIAAPAAELHRSALNRKRQLELTERELAARGVC